MNPNKLSPGKALTNQLSGSLGFSRMSTKSILTMDFDINDLSVAPDYEFREKSPRFAMQPGSPEKPFRSAPISPLSALPPSVGMFACCHYIFIW